MPESKADQSKADLLTSVNEAAGLVQKVFFTYLLVSLYLAVLIGSTTHEQLLRESGVQLPLFGVGLSVFWVYAVAPWLYLALHVNLLVQHYLLSRKLHAFNRVLEPLSAEEEGEWRVRIYPSMFAQMLAGAERRTFKRFVLCSIVFLTIAVAPIVLLLWMQIWFLPYHSELVTWGHRLALFVDLALLWYYWPLMMSEKDAPWRQIVMHERPLLHSSVCAFLSIGVLSVSTLIAVVPGGLGEWMTFARTADSRPSAAACETAEAQSTKVEVRTENDKDALGSLWQRTLANLRQRIPRYLDVREVDLLAEEPEPELIAALIMDSNSEGEDEDAAETLRERTVGLTLEGRDLRGANFRHADLTKADLERARLDGADLGCTKLIGAILSKAELRDANLTGAALHGAKLLGSKGLEEAILKDAILHSANLNEAVLPGVGLNQTRALRTVNLGKARLIGAGLDSAEMDGASLLHAKLQGAWLQDAKLRGANLQGADLRGANLRRAQLEGASLFGANLQGADLRGARIGGANFDSAKLRHADLRDIEGTNGKDGKIHDVIKNLSVPAAHGDRLAAEAVVLLWSADVHSIDLSKAKEVESALCENSSHQLKFGEVECSNEGAIEEYRQDLVEDVLVPLFCGKKDDVKAVKKETLSSVEASALLGALFRRASLVDEDESPKVEPAPTDQDEKPASVKQFIKIVTEAGDGTDKGPGDVARSTASALADALLRHSDCRGRDAFADEEDFEARLRALARTQLAK